MRKADLTDAQLQGAVLQYPQLQGASLDNAQLQGASLLLAQLQGASLDGAQLQAASLNEAELQGASLDRAQLQGALLKARSFRARRSPRRGFWGASLDDAQLLRASLDGASLWRAQLHVRSFQGLVWDQSADLPGKKLEETVPAGSARDNALIRIEILDPDKTFDDEGKVPGWRKTIEAAGVKREKYKQALAGELKALACSGEAGTSAPYIVRGLVRNGRIEATGTEASGRASISGPTRRLRNPPSSTSAEAEGFNYAIRLPAKRVVQERIGYLTLPRRRAHRQARSSCTRSMNQRRMRC